jgi:hypothetical protein
MSDASGPFAVPDFSQTASTDEELDGDDEEYDDDVVAVDDVDDDRLADDDDHVADDDDDVANDDAHSEPVNAVDVPSDGPVDGGVAQAVLEHIARSIVDEPDAVVVDASAQRGGVRLDLHVAPSDMGRIIGRRGRVAQALRAVVRAGAAKDGTDATVDIVD